jgi:hypothetical protein
VVYFKVLSCHSHRRIKENHKTSVRITGNQDEIRTGYLLTVTTTLTCSKKKQKIIHDKIGRTFIHSLKIQK